MNINWDKLTSGDTPTGVLAAVGILLLFVMFKVAKAGLKILIFLIALALFAGAAWWHFHHR